MSQCLITYDKIPKDAGFRMAGYWVWCGSAIRGEDGLYYLFASRWPRSLPFSAWMYASEIVRAVSDNPFGPFTFQEVVLPARGPQYWDGRCTHNPYILRHNGRYILYYMGSTHPFPPLDETSRLPYNCEYNVVGRANKRVGMAVAERITGPFTRFDEPLLPTRPGRFDNFLTSNPAAVIREDGSVCMLYKARAYLGREQNYQHGVMTIGAATASDCFDPKSYRRLDQPVFTPGEIHIEDPFLFEREGKLFMLAKDMNGNISGRKYSGICAESADGLHWQMRRGVVAYDRRITLWDGSETEYYKMERPFVLFEEGRARCIYFASTPTNNGTDYGDESFNLAVPIREFNL